MEKFTNRVMIDLEDYMKIIDDKKDTENRLNKELENNKFYIDEINNLSSIILNTGLNILLKECKWEQEKINEKLRNNEFDLSYYKTNMYDVLFEVFENQLICNMIISKAINNIQDGINKDKQNDKTSE